MSPALDLKAYVVGERVGTGIWDGEREMSIGLHAHREDRQVWSHGGLVGVLYHFQDFRLARITATICVACRWPQVSVGTRSFARLWSAEGRGTHM
jgi:hypothetical protein